jgi:hypothetical protein
MKVYMGKYPRRILGVMTKQIEYVKIDPWDTWSMDHTLAPIILPMLKQLKATKHGAPYVDLDDRPEELKAERPTDYDVDEHHIGSWMR